MKTTYINKDNQKLGMIIKTEPYPWKQSIEFFSGTETNIINAFIDSQNIDKNIIALGQRIAVLMRRQTLVKTECDKIYIPSLNTKIDNFINTKKHSVYFSSELDYLHRKLYKLDIPTEQTKLEFINNLKEVLC
jgi:hypothetical protein